MLRNGVSLLKIVLLISLLAAGSTAAQTISGAVYDQDGSVIPYARVSLVRLDSGKQQEIRATDAGDFSFGALAAGDYQLEIKHPGFALFRQAVQVKPGEDVRLHSVLELGRVLESVSIVGSTPPSARRPQPLAGQVKRAGGRVEPARLLAAPPPPFPESAQIRGAHGMVVIYAVIKADGTLGGLRVLSSPDPELEFVASEAVKQWRYQPAKLNGHPVETETTITFDYQLPR